MRQEIEAFKKIYSQLSPFFDEKLRRLFLGAFASAIGHGGISAVASASEMDRQTVSTGKKELESDLDNNENAPIPTQSNKTRRKGGGRKKVTVTDADLMKALDSLVSPLTRGDPESPLRWTSKSCRKLAEELTAMGHRVSHTTVSKLLQEMGYSLQANSKVMEGTSHPDRDQQFEHINAHAELFQ